MSSVTRAQGGAATPRHEPCSWQDPCGGEAGVGLADQGAAHIARAEPEPVQRSRADKHDREMAQRSLLVGRGRKRVEARRRGVSVYLPNRAIPMLPEALSSHMCSLVPNEDRLAMVVRIDFDRTATVKDTDFAAALTWAASRC